MFNRFTKEARTVVRVAQDEAAGLEHAAIGTEHLLLGILRDPGGAGARVLSRWDLAADPVRAEVQRLAGRGEPELDAGALATLGIDLDEIRYRVENTFGPGALGRRSPGERSHRPFTPGARSALELSLREAIQRGDRHIGSEHILLGLLRDPRCVAARILRAHAVDAAAVRDALAARPA